MYYKIRELRRDVARLACYASTHDFVSVGSVMADISERLTSIYSVYNDTASKLNDVLSRVSDNEDN